MGYDNIASGYHSMCPNCRGAGVLRSFSERTAQDKPRRRPSSLTTFLNTPDEPLSSGQSGEVSKGTGDPNPLSDPRQCKGELRVYKCNIITKHMKWANR